MNASSRLKHWIQGLLLGIALSFGALPAMAALSLSDIPLFLNQGAEPNIMFTLDDSGSMQWEIMPDNITYFAYLFPRGATNMYDSGDYNNYVPDFDSNNWYNFYLRSAHNNKIYYDPTKTYTPWAKYDGTLYPNASITNAYHNPAFTSKGGRDFTTSNSATIYWYTTSGYSYTTKSYWPATYYQYNSGDVNSSSSYTKVEIRSSTPTYTGGSGRTDCASAPTCTYAEEIQNFANWYTYYRSRILLARAGVGRAFSTQSTNMRVGFAAINKGSATIDGVSSTRTIVKGLRTFSGSDRQSFFTSLYTYPINGGTPLRRALENVGKYYTRTDNQGPWSKTPGTTDTSAHLTCRQSYAILMTDGYWNGSNPTTATGNVDNSTGPNITGPGSQTYQYTATNPYKDSWSYTLADVAMYYWNHDLRSTLTNAVPTNTADPAFWQHMVTFTIGLGVNGTLDPSTDLPDLTSGAKSWPQPCSDCTTNIDDLWHASINGRGNYFSASDPEAFATALSKTLNEIALRTSSASAIATNSTRLDTNTLIYQARFDSSDWDGQLLAFQVNSDGSVGSQAWDAATKIPSASSRNIFTINAGSGVTFQWANLNSTQQAFLNTDISGTTDTKGSDRVSYLRGDSSKEAQNGGTFRNRNSLLGDIINSDPYFVGTQNYGYNALSGTEGTDYLTFRSSSSYTGRTPTLYVGANDGMLHAFNANTGVEKFAYIPNAAIPNLSKLTSTSYSHRYYVDASPKAGDAYIGSTWKTVLLGAMGGGGKAVFALDVTDPDSFSASNVMWEFTHSELGYTIGQPTIARMHDGSWVAIFGNGYNSTSGKAQLFIVNLADGTLLKLIDTEVGSDNGLATPIPVDVDGDKITDYIYAGDLKGNMWKFDVSSSNTNSWDVAYHSGSTPKPLITVVDGSGNAQPITSRPEVSLHPDGGYMVFFGTGKFFEVGDNIVGSPANVQTFYGIRDQGSKITTGRGNLQAQTIQAETTSFGYDLRIVSQNAVANTKDGWYLDLVSPVTGAVGEQVISRPVLRSGRIIFATQIPSIDPCKYGGESWLMEMDAFTGARLDNSVFDLNNDGNFNASDYVTVTIAGTSKTLPVSGKKSTVGIIKTPGIVSAGTTEYKFTSGSSGNIETTRESGADSSTGRKSWRQLQ